MKKSILILSLIISVIILAQSCSKGDSTGGPGGESLDCSVPKSFSTDVNPIIQSFCNIPSCHTSGSSNGPGPLTNYTQVFNARSAIKDAVSTGAMPQNTSLSSSQRNKILCWIDSGASNN